MFPIFLNSFLSFLLYQHFKYWSETKAQQNLMSKKSTFAAMKEEKEDITFYFKLIEHEWDDQTGLVGQATSAPVVKLFYIATLEKYFC